jgi:hypothetical protein
MASLQRQAGNAAVQRLLTAQRFWPFDDDEDGGGGAEGAGPGTAPTDQGPEEQAAPDTAPAPVGDGPTSREPDEGGSSWWPFGGGEEERDDGGYTPAGDGPTSEPEKKEEEPVDEQSAEALFDGAVAAGNNGRALTIVVQGKGFGGPNVESITYVPGQGDDGLCQGKLGPGNPQRITIGPSALSAGYQYCASVVGHEVQHAAQRTQSSPITDSHVREFLAYSWQVLDGPPLSPADRKANAVQAMKNYAGILSPEDKFFYEPKFDQVRDVYNSLPATTP